MALTDFGKVIRKARIDADVSLAEMASTLATTPSFLSALEMGRKKIPHEWPPRIERFFRERGVQVRLDHLVAIANKSVPIDGLSPAQQMLVASVASADLEDEDIRKISALLKDKQGKTF